MKRRLHINDFFIQAIANSLRAEGKTEDADVFSKIDGNKWTWGYVSGGTNYGSAGNPLKAYGGNIQAYNVVMSRPLYYKNGVKTNFAPTVIHTIAMIPKEIRPPYLKNLTTAESNGKVTPELLGIDLAKIGCSYYSIDNSGGAKFVIVVGSDESVMDHNTVVKYLPFDMSVGSFNGGLQKTDPATKGYDSYGTSSISNNRVAPVDLIVFQGTAPAPAAKEINPNLPNWTLQTFTPTAPKGYETIPAMELTFDWTSLTGKYTSKVHMNTILIDLMVNALTTAGNTALAEKVKKINPETFTPWQVTLDTTNKKTSLVGARDSTAKLYFESVKFNNYLGKNYTMAVDMGYVYAESAGITWTMLASTTEMKSSALNTLLGESAMSYFGIHVTKGIVFNRDGLEAALPFSIKGVDIAVTERAITADTQQSINAFNVNPSWFGSNGFKIFFYPDRT